MSFESRIDYLLRAAARADREGNARLANILRKMAEELAPPEKGQLGDLFPLSSS